VSSGIEECCFLVAFNSTTQIGASAPRLGLSSLDAWQWPVQITRQQYRFRAGNAFSSLVRGWRCVFPGIEI
jgi:hypothetical protein